MGLLDRIIGGVPDRTLVPAGRIETETLRSQVEQLRGMLEQRAITELPWNVGADPNLTSPAMPSPNRALKLAPVYGAVSMIARSISTMPLHPYRKTGTGRTRMPYLPQLFRAPSIHGDLTDWLHRCMTSLLLWGNAYGLITARDGMGFPTMVEWLDPMQVQVLDEGMWGRGSFWDPIYYWRGRIIDREQLVHIPWFTVPFRVKGMSPMGALAAAVETGLSGQVFTQDWYKAGGVPPGTFKNSSQKLSPAEATEIKGRLVSAIRTHEPIVYGNDWDYKPITINPRDAVFVETHQLSATDIAVIYGIYPAERIGGVTKTSMTYTSVESESIQWANITLQPYASKLESHFFDLLPDPQYVKFALDSTIRSDTHTRYLIHQIRREIGLNNIDEIRDMEDMAPLPNGMGQDYNPLIAVRELIRSAAITTGNPNMPGFQAGEPTSPGSAGSPQATQGGQQGSPDPGRFTAQLNDLQPAGVASNGRSHASEEDDGLPPF